jgi:ABC-type sulfate/molybdate transport systems ATPase subunit
MYELLRRVRQETGVTVLHVTHNPDEARELADVVFNLRDGDIHKEVS